MVREAVLFPAVEGVQVECYLVILLFLLLLDLIQLLLVEVEHLMQLLILQRVDTELILLLLD